MRAPKALRRLVVALRRRRTFLVSCPRCKSLHFLGPEGVPFDPSPMVELSFWLAIGPPGMAFLAPQGFTGPLIHSRRDFARGRPAVHVCAFFSAAIAAVTPESEATI